MTKLYYKIPTKKQFEELKKKAIEIWQTYDDKYGYATEKINQVKNLENASDNFIFMVTMFDPNNQRRLANKLTKKTRKAVADRIRDGETPDFYNVFLIKN